MRRRINDRILRWKTLSTPNKNLARLIVVRKRHGKTWLSKAKDLIKRMNKRPLVIESGYRTVEGMAALPSRAAVVSMHLGRRWYADPLEKWAAENPEAIRKMGSHGLSMMTATQDLTKLKPEDFT